MSISKTEIKWGAFNFSRSDVMGFLRKKSIWYVLIQPNLEIKLGFEEKAWPFGYGKKDDQNKLPYLIYGDYRFLPEHVYGYHDDASEDTIQVWTTQGMFSIPRTLPEHLTQSAIPADLRDSTASQWIKAYKLHQSTPYSA